MGDNSELYDANKIHPIAPDKDPALG